MTPDQSDGSPGVRLTKMPSGRDCFSPVLTTSQTSSKSSRKGEGEEDGQF